MEARAAVHGLDMAREIGSSKYFLLHLAVRGGQGLGSRSRYEQGDNLVSIFFFDLPFVEARAAVHGLDMAWDIGFK